MLVGIAAYVGLFEETLRLGWAPGSSHGCASTACLCASPGGSSGGVVTRALGFYEARLSMDGAAVGSEEGCADRRSEKVSLFSKLELKKRLTVFCDERVFGRLRLRACALCFEVAL